LFNRSLFSEITLGYVGSHKRTFGNYWYAITLLDGCPTNNVKALKEYVKYSVGVEFSVQRVETKCSVA